MLYLSEAQNHFRHHFHETISTSSIHIILKEANLSWKVLERRAIQIQSADIVRFTNEMNEFGWTSEHLVFLDEVAIDNRCMIRRKGYGIKGGRLLYKGEFCRKPRLSMLCFIGAAGMLDSFSVEGNFTRLKFVECCRRFATEKNSPVRQYPGVKSVWIMDGAKIHLHPNIVYYLRTLGIKVIFLPAYSPFYNPIEIVFGLMKRDLKKNYIENSRKDLRVVVGEALNRFSSRSFEKLYQKCGYVNGVFDPSIAF